MKNSMNRKNVLTKTSAKETRGNAKSTMSARATTRRTDKLTSGGSANSHSRRGIFGAFLSVLMAAVMISSFTYGIFADDLNPITSGGTVPADENYTTNFATHMDGGTAITNDSYVNSLPKASNIQQSQSPGSVTTFAAGLPLSTIFIDTSQVGPDKGTFVSTNYPGIQYNSGSNVVSYTPASGTLTPGTVHELNGNLFQFVFTNAAILPDGNRANLRVTYKNAKIVVDQRLASLNTAYQGSVTLATGSSFSYNGTDNRFIGTHTYNLSGFDTNAFTEAQRTAANNAVGTYISQNYSSYGQSFVANNATRGPVLGVSSEATYQIVDNNGVPINGTFIFAMAGINLDRDPYTAGNNVAKPLWYINDTNSNNTTAHPELHFFSESIAMKTSDIASQYVYVRPNSDVTEPANPNSSGWPNPTSANNIEGRTYFWPQIIQESDQTRFISNGYSGKNGDDGTYSSGFVALADAAAGITVTAYGHGGGGASMNTKVFSAEQIWYRYTSSTGDHGKIQTTTEGNAGGKLSDGGTVIGPSGTWNNGSSWNGSGTPSDEKFATHVVAEGKTVTYTMTPDTGYKIDNIWIGTEWDGDGNVIKYKKLSFNTEDINSMKKGDSITVKTADESKWSGADKDKGEGILTYEMDGTYTFKFNHAKNNEAIHVEWTPTTSDILASKVWDDGDDKDGMRKKIYTNGDDPRFKLQYSLNNGRTWDDVTTNNITTAVKPSKSYTQEDVPSGYDSGQDKYPDGRYTINNDPNKGTTDPAVKEHPFTWEHLPVYTYDGSGNADRLISYRIVEIAADGTENLATEGYKTAAYYDSQAFELTSEKSKTAVGWLIYSDGTNQYALRGDDKYYDVDSDGNITGVSATQPDPDNLSPITSSDYRTADKAIPYQEVDVRNEHTVSDIYVEALKEWNDASLFGQTVYEKVDGLTVLEDTSGNQYVEKGGKYYAVTGSTVADNPADPQPDSSTLEPVADAGANGYSRRNITFTLHGTIKNSLGQDVAVDLDPNSPSDDLTITLTPGETTQKQKKVRGLDVVRNAEGTKYVLVGNEYHELNTAGDNYITTAADPQPKAADLYAVFNETFKIDNDNFGVSFNDLQAYQEGQLITYTVKESFDDIEAWTVTGGNLTQNKTGSKIDGYTMSDLTKVEKNEDLLGYTSKFINTPIVDDEYKSLPVTIDKKDAYTGQPLEGATFTVYTDAFNRDAQNQPTSTYKDIDGYTLYKDASNNQYVKKDGKFYAVSGTTIADNPADPQPSLTNNDRVKNDNYKQINGRDVWTDKKGHNYVLTGGKYYEADSEGNVSTTEADPQPAASDLSKIKTSGAVDQVSVVTDASGAATINFNETGTYYVVESSSPDGYEDESDKTYRFTVDKELMKVTLEDATTSDDHDTKWWRRLYDLIFGNGPSTDTDIWTQADNDRSGTLHLTNTPITANVMVRKTWDDANDQDGVRPTTDTDLPKVELQYTTDDVNDKTVTPTWNTAQIYDAQTKSLVNIDIKQFTNAGGAIHADDNNAYTWLSLPAYRNGKVVYYRIEETSPLITDGTYKITKNQTVSTQETNFKLVNDSLDSTNRIVEIVNKHTPQTLTLNAVKHWNDEDNKSGARASRLTMRLYKTANNQETLIRTITLDGNKDTDGPEIAAPDGNTWKAIFKDLPAYENGAPVLYRLEEVLDTETANSYVNKYYISYTKTDGTSGDADDKDSILANDVKRTYEEKKYSSGGTDYIVYVAGGKEYINMGSNTQPSYFELIEVTTAAAAPADPQPTDPTETEDKYTEGTTEYSIYTADGKKYINKGTTENPSYYELTTSTQPAQSAASPQPTDPQVVYTDDENTDATIRVDNIIKNNANTKKYWIGGANANIRFKLYRTSNSDYVNKDDATDVISQEDYEELTDAQKADYKPVIAMESKVSTADPIKSNSTISDGTTTYDIYVHANGKRYVNKGTDTVPEWHEIDGKGTDDTSDDEIVAAASTPKITTWTPFDTDGTTLINGWEEVPDGEHLFVTSAFSTSLSLPGDDEEHSFTNLPTYDGNEKPYTYRILETTTAGATTDERFEGHYSDDGLTVTNINKTMQEGVANVDVLKDLQGRSWNSSDAFYFYIDPIKSVNDSAGTYTEFAASEASDKDKVPVPGNGQQYGRALEQNTAVGSTSREVSFSPIIYDATDVDTSTHTSTYYYKVYESRDAAGNPVYQYDDKGIKYDGTLNSSTGVWSPKIYLLKVTATADANNVITTSHEWAEYKNGESALSWSTNTPVFKNTYASESDAKIWIEKNLASRAWENYSNGKGDAYQFAINSISGAPLGTPNSSDGSYYTMPLVTSSTSGNPQTDLQNYDTSNWAFGVTGNPISGDDLGSNGEATFIYEVFERESATSTTDTLGLSDYKVDGVEYDNNKLYVKVNVKDNGDGTLRFDAHYYTDASCKDKYAAPIHERWILDKTEIVYVNNIDDGDTKTETEYSNLTEANKNKYHLTKVQTKRLLDATEIAEVKAIQDDTQKTADEKAAALAEKGYRQVNVAYFTNIETEDIQVKKEWVDGPAVEDVTLHLYRHLFDLEEESSLNNTFVTKAEEAWNKDASKTEDFWEVISRRYDVPRGDFLKDDGTPKYNAGTNISSQTYGDYEDKDGNTLAKPDYISGFNADLPKYVWVTENDRKVLKRAVYKLSEDDTSDAYDETYRTKKGTAADVEGSQIYIDGETLIVKNTVVATNTANIAAVKQLLGRNWLDTDDFKFVLTPVGKGKYNDNGEFIEPDKSDAAKAKVPMPSEGKYVNKNESSDVISAEEYKKLTELGKNDYTHLVAYQNNNDPADIITVESYYALDESERTAYSEIDAYQNKDDTSDIITQEAYDALSTVGQSGYKPVKVTNAEAHAKDSETTVDPNGNLERLARFNGIEFSVDDLEYNAVSKHYQGDFFYTMTEELPEISTEEGSESYPTEYTYSYKENGETKTRTVAITNKQMPTLAEGQTFVSVVWNNGITYDMTEHTLHIRVRENRTGTLEVQVGYDEDEEGTISTGTQFTPVYTNKYAAEAEVEVEVNKYIMGRYWNEDDNFDFVMIPMAGAPFKDANPSDFPDASTTDDRSREAALEEEHAIHNKDGEHVKRMFVKTGDVGTDNYQKFTYPKILVTLEDLHRKTTAEQQATPAEGTKDTRLKYKDGTVVPVGTAYGQFMYAIEETDEFDDLNNKSVEDLIKDPDTEYARVTVIDKEDGTLDYYVEIFEDRYGTIQRYKPDPVTGEETTEPASAVTFVNKLSRNLSVTKAWDGAATEDVTLKLQWSVGDENGVVSDQHWYDVESTAWFNVDGTRIISKDATGKDLTVTWEALPAYANISDYDDMDGDTADDKDLNDKWIYYRVVEVNPGSADVRYNTVAYVQGDTPSTKITVEGEEVNKYSTTANHTGPEKEKDDQDNDKYLDPDDRVKQLYVTNFPTDIKKDATIGVVKQYIGKNWTNEKFTFQAEPVKSKLGSDSDYVDSGEKRTIINYVHSDTGAVITAKQYAKITDTEEKAKYTEHKSEVTNTLPAFNKTNGNKATAEADETKSPKVSVNEHAANFDGLTIKRSDLAYNSDTKRMEGEFVYKITEVIPENAVETDEACGTDSEGNTLYYYVATDTNGNKIKYTTEENFVTVVAVDDGGGELDITVTYNGRDSGTFVPVYTNYALMRTPIEGSKTWIGGDENDHKNGTVELSNENKEIAADPAPTDKLGLVLQRKLESENSFTDLTKDDAGNDLVIVWVKELRTEIKGDPTEYSYKDPESGETTTISAEEYNDNPDSYPGYEASAWAFSETFSYIKQETGNGTYTIKAKVTENGETRYIDPMLDLVDNDGYEYTYQIREGSVPDNYTESINGLNVTNTYNVNDDIKVTKTWDDAKNAAGLRPDKVVVHLYKVVNEVTLTDREKTRARESVDKSDYDDDDDGEVDPDRQADYEAAQDAAEAAALAKKQAEEGEVQVEVAKKEIKPASGEKDSWTTGITWEGLPVYDENGDIIKYVVTEESVSGYTTKYSLDGGDYADEGDDSLIVELDSDTDEDPQTIDIKNSLTPATDTVKVTKVWDDESNKYGDRPATVEFELYKSVWNKTDKKYDDAVKVTTRPATAADVSADQSGDTKLGDDITVTKLELNGTKDSPAGTVANETDPTDANTWNGEWINLPLEENGKTIIYTVKEVISGSEFGAPKTEGKYSNEPCISGDQVKGYTVKNTYTPETTTASVTKNWVDNSNKLNVRPDTLTVELWRMHVGGDGNKVHEKVTTDVNGYAIKSIISADDKTTDNTWKLEYENLPKKIAVETTNDSYAPVLTVEGDNPEEKGWYERSGEDEPYTYTQTTDIEVDNNKTYYEKTSTTGVVSRDYTYYWKEDVPTGYTATVSGTAVDSTGDNDSRTNIQRVANGEKITNTYITGAITLTKTWDDQSNIDRLRPNSSAFASGLTLYANNIKLTSDYFGANGIRKEQSAGTGDDADEYYVTYSNLPVYDKNGQKIVYTAEENVPEGYTIASDPEAVLSVTLNNTQEEPTVYTGAMSLINEHTPELTDLEITKNWIDQEGFAHVDAEDYKNSLNLYADGSDVTSTYADKLTVTPTSDSTTATKFTVKWSDLPKYKVVGSTNPKLQEIVYKVEETQVTGYAAATYDNKGATDKTKKPETAAAYDGGEINNTQNISIDVKKTWDDNDNHDGKRGDIKVVLFRNGMKLDEKTLKETDTNISKNVNIWTWTKVWENLPYADENGMTYNYTASEEAPQPWYTALFNGEKLTQILLNTWNDAKDTLIFEVTNKHDDETIGFTVDKIWDDGNDVDNVRPAKIYYRLYQEYDGIAEADKLITTLPTGATVKTATNTAGMTTTDATYSNGYVDVDARKSDKTQGTLNRVIFEGLPKYARVNTAAAGQDPVYESKEITYTIKEDGNVGNDSSSVTIDPITAYNLKNQDQMPTITGDQGKGYTVTNEHNTEKITFTGHKQWIDGGLAHNNSAELTSSLKIQSTTVAPNDWNDQTQWTAAKAITDYHVDWSTATTADDTFTISGLPKYDENGRTIYYRVVENAIANYKTTYTNSGTYSGKTDAIYEGGTVVNTAKVGDVKITKKFLDGDDNVIPTAVLPAGFKISVTYKVIENGTVVDKTADLKVGDATGYAYNSTTGVHTWTLSDVVYGSKVTAEEKGYKNPAGYTYDSTTTTVEGKDWQIHTDDSQTYAELVMPASAATRSVSPGTDTANPSVAFVNKYTRDMGKLDPQKVWNDDSNRDGKRPASVTYRITATNGGNLNTTFDVFEDEHGDPAPSTEITFSTDYNDGDTWTYFSDMLDEDLTLPTHADNGTQITYVVQELGTDDGEAIKTAGYTPDEARKTTTLAKDATKVVSIRNTYDPVYDNLKVSKIWDDAQDAEGLRPDSVVVHLYRTQGTGQSATQVSAGVEEKTLNEANNWTATWTELPVSEDGAKIEYVVVEEAVAGYTTTFNPVGGKIKLDRETKRAANQEDVDEGKATGVGEFIDKEPDEVKITNTLTPAVSEVKASKFWDDESDAAGKRPKTVIFELYEYVWNETTEKYDGPTKVTKRPATQADVTADIAEKVGDDVDVPAITLDGAADTVNTVAYETAKTDANNWNCKWVNLPETKNGKTVIYTVRENPETATGYMKSVVTGNQFDGFKVTNSYEPLTGEVLVDKVWDDEGNEADKRTGTAPMVKLQSTTKDPSAQDFDPDTDWTDVTAAAPKNVPMDHSGKITDASADKTYTWGNLPALKDGKVITYRVVETGKLADYDDPTYSVDTFKLCNNAGTEARNQEVTVTNTYSKTEVEVTKKWIDSYGNASAPATGVRPDADAYKGSVTLKAGDNPVIDDNGTPEDDSDDKPLAPDVTDNEDGTYTLKWMNLPKYKTGVTGRSKIEYSVTESKITGYSDPVYSDNGKALDGGTITNTQLIKVDVVKKWNDNDNHDGQRPDMIKVTLYQNGVEYPNKIFGGDEKELKLADATTSSKSVDTLNENDTFVWENAWVDLPYADDNGTPYNYTATETNLDGSGLWGMLTNRKTIRQILLQEWKEVNNEEIKDTLIFRIDNDDTEDKVDFSVDKIWDDANDVDGLRPGDGVKPEKIYFRLYQTIDGQATSVWDLPAGAKVKFRSNIDSTIEDVTSQYTEGYIAVEPKKDDKTQGTLNRVVFENLPKYARVNKGTSENPDWESVEIEYSVKEDGDVEETDGNKTAHTPVIDDVKVWKSDKTKAITPYTTAYGGDYEKGITVTNKHEPMKYDKEPEAKKVITGRKFKSGDKFTFTIEPVDGAPRPAKDYVTITPTVGQSEYTFKLPKFTFYGSDMKDKIENGDTKVFEYTVTELKGDLEDMTYDATSKTLKIAVTRNEDGTIEIKDGGVVWGNGREGADIFTNVYNDTTKLVIRKIWSDDDADNTVLGSRPFDSVNELRPEVIKFKITATTTVDTPALVADGVGFTKESDTEYTKEVSLSESENGTVFNRNVWQKTVDGLPKLDAAGEGITYRVDEKQLPNYEDPIVDPDGIDDGRWIITNVYKRASFTATKIWDDGNLKHDNATELKNKLKLYRTTADDPTAQGTQWTEVTDKYHLHWNDDGATADNKYSQSFTITGLPEKDADGKQYTYRVVESSVGDKYTTTYKNNDNTATSDYDESKVDEAVLDGGTITNSYQGKIIVKAQKVWEGDSEDKSKRSAVEFQLIRIRTEDNASRDVDAAKPATKGQTDDFEPIDGTNDDHYVVWPDLPTVVEGKAVSYDVKEVSVPDGYSSKTEYYNKTTDKWDDAIPDKGDWDVEKVGDEDVKVLKVRITNTLDVNETQVVVQKKWDDDDDQDRKRPKSVTVSIDAYGWDGKDIDGEDVDSITLNDDNNWKSVWKKLPKTDSEGKVYDYTVSEDAVDDYTTVVEYQSKGDKSWNVDKPEDWNNKVRVTNSYTPGRITVEVEKVWDGDEHLSDEERVALRSDVIVHLYGFKDEQVVYYAGSKKIEMDDQGEPVGRAMFANVPKRYFNDDDLDWKVVEDPVFGYTSTVSDVVPIDEGGKRYEATVTNTYAAPVTTVKVTKEWQDDNNNDGKRPENVYYQLWKKVGDKDKEKVGKPVKAVEAPTSPAGTGETGQLDGWGYQWTKLPVTEEIETEETTTTSRIEYVTKYRNKFDESIVIDETAYSGLPQTGGKSSYTYDETSGMYMPTAGGESIDQDEYDALNAQEDYEAENVPVEKKEENVKVKKEVPVLYVVEEIYEKADWTDLPDDDNLDDLDYEEPIVEAVNPGEFNVINGKKNETVDVKFIKMWNDHNDEDEIRPDHLTVVLKNDKDLPEKKVTITKGDDGWNEGYYTFTGLQKYVKGESVDYSIVELDVDGKTEIRDGGIYDKGEYSVAILKEETAVGQPESWVITNTHTLGNTEELVAIKEWEEYDGDKSKRTDVVFHLVRVYEDGARKIIDDEYPPITTATGTDHEEVLTATWTDLPTRIDKKPVAYTVEEETVDGYTTIVGDTVEKYEKVEAEGTEDPSALGWYEAEDEGYKPTEDTKVEDKDYFTRHHEVIVTNTKGVIPDRGDVIYVDPLGKAGGVGSKNMILKSTRYRTPEEAKEAMDKETNAPKVPSHPGKIFTGWAHNWDENDNFVLVATYADVADKPDPVVSYVDPQTGKIVTGVKGKVKKPADPKAKNMQFVKWVKTTDAAGNTIYVAQYECDCSNGGGKSVDKSNVDTGDDAMLTVWMLLFVMAVSFMILTMMVRRRGINVVRDNYRPKH